MFPQLDSGLAIPSFLPGDDTIASLNKAMAFISTTIFSCFRTTNNQLRTSSNPRNQATIQDGRVLVQNVPERQNQGYASSGARGQIARQYTKPKRPKNFEWFKEKMLLAHALESGVVFDEEQMAFLADNEDTFITCQTSQELTTTAIFQTDDLDSFDYDCDEAPSASVVLVAKLLAYDSGILSEVPTLDTYQNDNEIDQGVPEIQYSEQPPFSIDSDIDITSDSNVISYEQYLKESKNAVVQDTTSTTQQDALIMSVIEETSNQVAQCNAMNKENKIVNESLTAELERCKE
ncbi:hypothetical protein Tco_1058082 [Tanacetum coccineum]|uniref:Retrovirus-related Pol polyprotein from transposon TNT 1-94 n=1 Tax=Tanacetum coccineum TaxID=301880 RepID=A0ABQ5H7X2_9ASTR